MDAREICLVEKNKLLVYGHSTSNNRVLELHQLANNSPTSITSVTLLFTEAASKDYIMHSCDFTGGAWLRSTNPEEEHAFYDPGTQKLYKNNGPVVTDKIIAMANSKRGFYFTASYDPATNTSKMSYSDPENFWNPSTINQKVDHSANTKILRLDNPSIPENGSILFLIVRKDND